MTQTSIYLIMTSHFVLSISIVLAALLCASVASAADPTDAPLTPSPDLLCYTSCIQEPRSPAECFVSCPAFCPANCTSQFNGRCDYKIGRCICAQYYFKGDNCSTPIVDEKPYTKPFTDEDVEPNWSPSIWLGVLVVLAILVAERIYTTCRKFVIDRSVAAGVPQGGQDGFQPIVHSDEPEDDIEMGTTALSNTSKRAAPAAYSITDDDSALVDESDDMPTVSASNTTPVNVKPIGVASSGSGAASKVFKIGGSNSASRK